MWSDAGMRGRGIGANDVVVLLTRVTLMVSDGLSLPYTSSTTALSNLSIGPWGVQTRPLGPAADVLVLARADGHDASSEPAGEGQDMLVAVQSERFAMGCDSTVLVRCWRSLLM